MLRCSPAFLAVLLVAACTPEGTKVPGTTTSTGTVATGLPTTLPAGTTSSPCDDDDGDGQCNDVDPCPSDPLDDSDNDGSCDSEDICAGHNDTFDLDGDTVPDGCDPCPVDAPDDSDNDGSCDSDDICAGFDDTADADGDGAPDGCDVCPDDALDDSDNDGSCDSDDICVGFDDTADADADTVPDGCDPCPADNPDDSDNDTVCDSDDICAGDDRVDTDTDGQPDACDPCPLDIDDDSDNDTVCDSDDICPYGDDLSDVDGDGLPDSCDSCPLDNPNDSDGDGVCNRNDRCNGHPDNNDIDGDGIPDGCDDCPLDNPNDTDADGVCNSQDICIGFDDRVDTDGDGTPDGCDACPNSNPNDIDRDGVCDDVDICLSGPNGPDFDGDGVPDACDPCPQDFPDDSDGDGVCDIRDACPDFDDAIDADGDGQPDLCDPCPDDFPDDTDNDGVCESVDVCRGFDDNQDTDGDGVADGCDDCPFDLYDDSDGDGLCDSDDGCPGFDDRIDTDGDGIPDGCDPCPDAAASDCRPVITVTSPQRGATLETPVPGPIAVTGTVVSAQGAIAWLEVNGVATAVDPADGSFATTADVIQGGNTLELVAEDVLGAQGRVVQGLLAGSTFIDPDATTPVAPGLGVWLGPDAIDDGLASPPLDLQHYVARAMPAVDLGTLFSPTSVALRVNSGGADFDITIESLTHNGAPVVDILRVPGGLQLSFDIPDIVGVIDMNCVDGFLTCSNAGGDERGTLTATRATLETTVAISVLADHSLSVVATPTTARFTGVALSPEGTDESHYATIRDATLAEIGDAMEVAYGDGLDLESEGLLAAIFDGLTADWNLPFSAPDAGGYTVDVSTDFHSAPPDTAGLELWQRVWATTNNAVAPYAILGVPLRESCGAGPLPPELRRNAPIEWTFGDDALNTMLFAAWQGGWLEYPVSPGTFSSVDLAGVGIDALTVTSASGMLPPVASDCSGAWVLQVRDLELRGSLTSGGVTTSFTAYAQFDADLSLAPTDELTIVASNPHGYAVQLDVVDEEAIAMEPALEAAFESTVVPAIAARRIDGGTLVELSLPSMDLSGALGEPASTTWLSLTNTAIVPSDGTSLLECAIEDVP